MDVKQLKKQAKELLAAARAGDAGAVARFGDLPLKLAGAQLVLAREHGYPSWPRSSGSRSSSPSTTTSTTTRAGRKGSRR